MYHTLIMLRTVVFKAWGFASEQQAGRTADVCDDASKLSRLCRM